MFFFLECGSVRADEHFNITFQNYLEYFPFLLFNNTKTDGSQPKDSCNVAIYRSFNNLPLWVNQTGPNDRAEILLARLIHSRQDGLNPSEYDIKKLETLWNSQKPIDLTRLDLLLTQNLLSFLKDIHIGRQSSRNSDIAFFTCDNTSDLDPVATLQKMLRTSDFNSFLNSFAPHHFQYDDLRHALSTYYLIADNGGWSFIPEFKRLIRPGQTDKNVQFIRERLAITGDLADVDPHDFGFSYDPQLQEAVRTFQSRHGLKTDGVIGPKTIASMNVPVETRIQQIILNMERWRWQKNHLGEKYVLVDIAGFKLQGIENDRIIIEIPVIVGKSYQQTPVFSDRISYIEFNPYWNIPNSIARKEILPELVKDPGYLVNQHIRVFSSIFDDSVQLDPYLVDWKKMGKDIVKLRLRQDPGPWNVLGKMKFVFPNKYDVYLHDTLTQQLFEENRRAYSHGCIRVAEPEQLALFVLGGKSQGWSLERINKIVITGKRKIVTLRNPLAIHLTYRTAWMDNKGILHFRDDIYRRDQVIISEFFKKMQAIIE